MGICLSRIFRRPKETRWTMKSSWDTILPMIAEKKTYIFWLDLIRVVSIFMVVLIHATSPLLNGWEDLTFSNWMAGNIYTAIARACVPLLFMVSGYLLLSKQETIASFYANRFKKVIVPFLAWSVIYLVWQNGYANYTFFNAIKAIILSMITGSVYYHFWFLYALISIYLFVPLLQVFVHSASEQALWYAALIWFAFGPLLDFIEQNLGYELAVKLGFFTEYIGYFFIGYVLGRLKYPRWAAGLAAFVYVASVVYTAYATLKVTAAFGDYNDFYLVYLRLNIVIMSLSAFIWMKALGEKMGTSPQAMPVRLFRGLAGSSFGVYLVHAMMLSFVRRGAFGFEFSALSGPAIYTAPLVTILVFIISLVIVLILQKIPYLRAIVPN